ncbi:MAG: ShlB/FhaC/HecB family hemolysin secretion/activation protein [Gammaproteobacteria bacterium]|nr:ShlB/FhaC/HecB family hemolysin secretion/activation protein [Gammaproteobacteria bacterium]
MMQRMLAQLLVIILIAAFIENAWSETFNSLPSSVMPSQVSKALRNSEPTSSEPHPIRALEARSTETQTGLPKEDDKIKFKLNSIILVGNHVYSETVLQSLYQNSLHKEISVSDLFAIVNRITNFYRNNGYILSRALLPPQRAKEGIVRIQIIEGYINNVEISGNSYGAGKMVKRFGNKIKQCPPLRLNRMEKYLMLANDLPATDVKAVLSPSKNKVGAADLTLVTDNKPVTAYLSYDNYGTRYIGPQQMTGNVGFNSFLTSGDSTQVTVTKTPKGGELTFMDINYNRPIDEEGTRWAIGGTQVQTHPLFVLRPVEIDGLNDNYYTMWYFPVIHKESQSLILRAGFNYLDTYVTILNSPLYTDHLRSLNIGGTYNFADRWYGANLVSVDVRQGLPIFGYTADTNPNTATTSRPGGHGNYTKLVVVASRLQSIKGPLYLYGMIQGQEAASPLLAPEQFSIGGSQIGRGYDVAELIGDKGAASTLELRLDQNFNKPLLQKLQFYVFYDAGMIWNFKYIGGVPRKQSLTSTGLGIRFFASKYISGNIMWTQPLTKTVAAQQLIGEGKRPRIFFSLVAAYQ